MDLDESTLPQQVRNFLQAVRENAHKVEGWDDKFISTLLYVTVDQDNSVTVCDNYERFFSTVYTYTYGGKWIVRSMYDDRGDRPYSYAQAMGDAQVMYTG